MLLRAGLAELAFPAGLGRVERNFVTDCDGIYIGSAGYHGSGGFVAEHDRLAHANGPETAIVPVVQIRTANAACTKLDQNIVRSESWKGYVLNLDVILAVQPACTSFHDPA